MFLCLGCFSCCMENGIRIYNIVPLVEKTHYGKLIILNLHFFNFFLDTYCNPIMNLLNYMEVAFY